jgi:hypothetical protein
MSPIVKIQGNLELENKGDLLIARSRSGYKLQLFGAFIAFFGLLFLFLALFGEDAGSCSISLWPHPSELVCRAMPFIVGSIFAAPGIAMMLPHKITTIFNLTARRVLQDRQALGGLYRRRYVYLFSQVRGIMMVNSEGTFLPFINFVDGKRLALCFVYASYGTYHPSILKICADTHFPELPMIDE